MKKTEDPTDADSEEMREIIYNTVIAVGGLEKFPDSEEIYRIIDRVLEENPHKLADHIYIRDKWTKFLMGQVMKATKGQANPEKARDAIKQRLAELAASIITEIEEEDSTMKPQTEPKEKEDIMMNQDSESHKDSNEIPIKKTRTKPKKEDSTMKEDYIRGLGKSWNWVTDDYRYWHNCLCVGKVNHLEPGPSGKCEVLFLASGMWGLDEKPKRTIVDREGNGFSWIHEQWNRAEHKRLGKKYVQQAYSHIIEKKRKAIKSTSVPTTTKKKETNDEK